MIFTHKLKDAHSFVILKLPQLLLLYIIISWSSIFFFFLLIPKLRTKETERKRKGKKCITTFDLIEKDAARRNCWIRILLHIVLFLRITTTSLEISSTTLRNIYYIYSPRSTYNYLIWKRDNVREKNVCIMKLLIMLKY